MSQKEKFQYQGYYVTAEGTHNRGGYEYTSLRAACKSMRALAIGNRLHGSTARWSVERGDGVVVAEGKV